MSHPCANSPGPNTFFNPDSLNKMEATLSMVSAYLDKATAAEWWKTWIADAKKNTTIQIPGDLEGKNSMYMWCL